MAAEGFAYHRDNLVHRWDDYGCYTRPILARGALTSSADYAQAQRFRSWFRREVATLFASYDVLITPGSLGPAERTDKMQIDGRFLGPSFTGQWNFAGLPAVVLPCGAHSLGLPLALQIVGRPFAEATVLRVADAYQRDTDWHLRVPPTMALVAA
jgi:aspartyl-tRNA(Asn)/glutamyl-tRNA(Gln) amidotransferase subunit A